MLVVSESRRYCLGRQYILLCSSCMSLEPGCLSCLAVWLSECGIWCHLDKMNLLGYLMV